VHLAHTPDDMPAEAAKTIDTYVTNDHHRFGLKKMGLLTALAIGIHNLPEGLATFVAALADPLNGVAIAVAIALHNIPEGVCVAMPVYYATGSRWKGFWWATLSGVSEPIGGLLGYAVLYGNRMSDIAYGLLFCLVAGMMVRSSVQTACCLMWLACRVHLVMQSSKCVIRVCCCCCDCVACDRACDCVDVVHDASVAVAVACV
jgi:zinc transporter ZupT